MRGYICKCCYENCGFDQRFEHDARSLYLCAHCGLSIQSLSRYLTAYVCIKHDSVLYVGEILLCAHVVNEMEALLVDGGDV